MPAHARSEVAETSPRRAAPPGVPAQVRARGLGAEHLRALQRSAGNQAVARLMAARRNATGIPDAVKHGAEQLSGLSLDDVRVHYGSARPAALGALAYTEGSDIHVGPGQERHVPHEVWHAVQQKQGRVSRSATLGGRDANIDPALEDEADEMGERAGRSPVGPEREPRSVARASRTVVQPRLGFEIEMLALVDINGRPIPEKTTLGTYGAQNLTLTVDHGAAVAAATPTPAVEANFSVPHGGGGIPHGRYDTPLGTQTRVGFPVGAMGVDPRLARPPTLLHPVGWGLRSANVDRRAAGGPDVGAIDVAVTEYERPYEHFQAQRAGALLTTILNAIGRWRTANPRPRLFGVDAWQAAENVMNALFLEAAAHAAMWLANPNPPPGMVPLFLNGGWSPQHPTYGPLEGMGTDQYASILEIVTPGGPGFEPELPAGRLNIIAAMTQAAALAQAIEVATHNFTQRVALNTVPGVAVRNPATHIGNAGQPAQTTDASIQSTLAIDLAQLATFVSSTVGFGAQSQFTLKHHADTFGTSAFGIPVAVDRAKVEMARAVGDAGQILTTVGRPVAPSLVNLRGLLVLICQYLRMGRYFVWQGQAGLDKNLVDLLSRTDLSDIYNDGVPGPVGTPGTEQAWTQANLVALENAILAQTGRAAGATLFTDPTEAQNLGGPLGGLTTAAFVHNVFTAASDGVTPNLGGFRQMGMETVDPAGARGGDTRTPGALQRTGPVFELRNMKPVGAERFPRTSWIGLATYMTNLLQAVNARNEAGAVRDARYGEATGVMHPASGNW
jgi:hypothetical protein